jgi:hypothetical protein
MRVERLAAAFHLQALIQNMLALVVTPVKPR